MTANGRLLNDTILDGIENEDDERRWSQVLRECQDIRLQLQAYSKQIGNSDEVSLATKSINDLYDVTVESPTDGQVLTWDGERSVWNAEDASSGGTLVLDGGVNLGWSTTSTTYTVRLPKTLFEAQTAMKTSGFKLHFGARDYSSGTQAVYIKGTMIFKPITDSTMTATVYTDQWNGNNLTGPNIDTLYATDILLNRPVAFSADTDGNFHTVRSLRTLTVELAYDGSNDMYIRATGSYSVYCQACTEWYEISGGGGGGSGAVDSVFGRTGAVVAATDDYTWAQIDKTTSDIADIATRSHTDLTDIGTNTHPQIDSHVGSTANPHSVTAAQIGDLANGSSSGAANYALVADGAGGCSWAAQSGIVVSSVFGRTGAVTAQTNDYIYTQVDNAVGGFDDLTTANRLVISDGDGTISETALECTGNEIKYIQSLDSGAASALALQYNGTTLVNLANANYVGLGPNDTCKVYDQETYFDGNCYWIGESSVTPKAYLTSYADAVPGPRIYYRKARGTEASPSNISSGDIIGYFIWAARLGGAWSNVAQFQVASYAPSGAHADTYMTIRVDDGSSMVNAAVIGSDELRHRDGLVSRPGMNFQSDTNSGIYRIGSDNVGAAAGSSLAFSWKSDGIYDCTLIDTNAASDLVLKYNGSTAFTIGSTALTAADGYQIIGSITDTSSAAEIISLAKTVNWSGTAATGTPRVCQYDFTIDASHTNTNFSHQCLRFNYEKEAGAANPAVSAFTSLVHLIATFNESESNPVYGVWARPTVDTGKTVTSWYSYNAEAPSGAGSITTLRSFYAESSAGKAEFVDGMTNLGDTDFASASVVSGGLNTQDGTFGHIYAYGIHDSLLINNTTWTKMDGFTSDGESNDCTLDAANDRIQLTRTGKYEVTYDIDFENADASHKVLFAIYWNSSRQDETRSELEPSNTGIVYSISRTAIIDVTSANQYIELYAYQSTGSNYTIYMEGLSLTIRRVGDT